MNLKLFALLSVLPLLTISSFTFTRNKAAIEKTTFPAPQAQSLAGAWRLTGSPTGQAGVTAVKILSDNYFMVAYYDLSGKKFISSQGGTYSVNNGKYTETLEFHTQDSAKVETSLTSQLSLKGKQLSLSGGNIGKAETWERIDGPPTAANPLAGAWRIGEREQDGKMVPMPRGARKTIKMLSGTRFQWAAINPETRQFFGTGGGTYTAKDGKYTENIEFFSRDGSRVGASLSFDFSVSGNDWLHSGLSSTGNPIKEIWRKE